MSIVNIAGLDKAEILRRLYTDAKPEHPEYRNYNLLPMTLEEAHLLIEKNLSFDILNGRVMKINLANDTVDTFIYDRHNGQGVAEQIIENIRRNNQPKISEEERVYRYLTSLATGISEEKINDIVGDGYAKQFHRDGLLCPHCSNFTKCDTPTAMRAKGLSDEEIYLIAERQALAEIEALALFSVLLESTIKNNQMFFLNDDPDFVGDKLMEFLDSLDDEDDDSPETTT